VITRDIGILAYAQAQQLPTSTKSASVQTTLREMEVKKTLIPETFLMVGEKLLFPITVNDFSHVISLTSTFRLSDSVSESFILNRPGSG
jgi:hypothetical protein